MNQPAQDPMASIFRRIIAHESCIYVRDQATGLVAHVFGYSTSRPGGPKNLTIENAKEFHAHAAAACTIDIREDQLELILALVTEIKGSHEYSAVWGKPGEV